MDAPLSKATHVQQHPPPTLVAPKATSAMIYVCKRATPMKQ